MTTARARRAASTGMRPVHFPTAHCATKGPDHSDKPPRNKLWLAGQPQFEGLAQVPGSRCRAGRRSRWSPTIPIRWLFARGAGLNGCCDLYRHRTKVRGCLLDCGDATCAAVGSISSILVSGFTQGFYIQTRRQCLHNVTEVNDEAWRWLHPRNSSLSYPDDH